MRVIVWLTLDLRLKDHPALHAAARDGEVLPVFILDRADPWWHGGASRWWLHHSLAALAQAIKARGGRLILREGDTLAALQDIATSAKAEAIYCSRAYEPWLARLQHKVHEQFAKEGIDVRRFGGRLLLEPDRVLTKQGRPYQVFTPFYKEASAHVQLPAFASAEPEQFFRGRIASAELNSWSLLPARPNWAAGFKHWQPGEIGAAQVLEGELDEVVNHYADERDLPARAGTSRLSPHLHFGEVSPRQVLATARAHQGLKGAETFVRQLYWREFGHYLLHHFPRTPTKPFKEEFQAFQWRRNPKLERRWQRGNTGYPIVDAGMRELWHTGWMHNRVRMIVASFLTKHLNVPWLEGARWFWDTLLDADLANNTLGWQWVAGCGADAAPYFRIFNPTLQGEKFDPKGEYVKRWVPELAKLDAKYVHAPWQAPPECLAAAGVELGNTYPEPMVDHKNARAQALQTYGRSRHSA